MKRVKAVDVANAGIAPTYADATIEILPGHGEAAIFDFVDRQYEDFAQASNPRNPGVGKVHY